MSHSAQRARVEALFRVYQGERATLFAKPANERLRAAASIVEEARTLDLDERTEAASVALKLVESVRAELLDVLSLPRPR
jgi:hypothetical protein